MKDIIKFNNFEHISYAEFGNKNGFPILIQHGLIASINEISIFKKLIENGFRIIAIARPGYGESSPYIMKSISEWGDIISILIKELKIDTFEVFGISSGAPYAYSIGYKFPEKAKNIFILSGIPALYDEQIQSFWPHKISKEEDIKYFQKLAFDLFFSKLSQEDLLKDDIRDSMMNDCLGLAQDLMLRSRDWGFRLSDIKNKVYMQHSRYDEAVPFITAEKTAQLLPNCEFIIKESKEHFSLSISDEFIDQVLIFNSHYLQ
jgi:pimeloyl-ACP methyl ester carboxylesterase